jgi:hypothetical protein
MITITPTEIKLAGDSKIVTYSANKGYGVSNDASKYPNAIVCLSGACSVKHAGKTQLIYKHGMPVNLAPNEPYEVESLEDNTFFANIFYVESKQ